MLRRKTSGSPLSSALKIVVSVGLLVYVLYHVGWRETWQTIRAASPAYLVAALALDLLAIPVRAYRWQALLEAIGVRVGLARLTGLYFVGTFFSDFLPTGVGGDVVRAYELAEQTQNSAAAVGTVLVDRATGLLMLFLIASFSLLFSHSLVSPQIAWVILLLTAVSWGGSIFLVRRDWLERLGLWRSVARFRSLEKVYECVRACGARAVGKALGVSLVLNVLLICLNYLIALALGVRVSLWYFFLFVPIISFLLVLPVSLSGWGLRQGGYVYLFSQAGVSAQAALTLALIVQFFQLAIGLIGAVIYATEGIRGFRAASRGQRSRKGEG